MIEKKLTILVPLKDRHKYTKRFFKFIKKFNLKYFFIFADGSDIKLPKNYLDILKSSKVKFKYLRFKKDSNAKIFLNKLYLSLLEVETEYVMLFDNDDIPISKKINFCLKKLEKNKELAGCGGYRINFNLFEIHKNKKILDEYYGNPINIVKVDYGNNYISQSSVDRVKSYLTKKKPINTINDIFRSKFLLKNLQIIKKRNFNFLSFYLLLFDFLNVFNGKVLKINSPFLLHQINSLSFSKKQSIYDKIYNKKYFKDKKNFLSFVISNTRKNKNKIKKYLNFYFSEIENKKKFKKLSKHKFPSKIKKIPFLRYGYQNLKNRYLLYYNKELSNFLKEFDDNSLQFKKLFKFLKKEI